VTKVTPGRVSLRLENGAEAALERTGVLRTFDIVVGDTMEELDVTNVDADGAYCKVKMENPQLIEPAPAAAAAAPAAETAAAAAPAASAAAAAPAASAAAAAPRAYTEAEFAEWREQNPGWENRWRESAAAAAPAAPAATGERVWPNPTGGPPFKAAPASAGCRPTLWPALPVSPMGKGKGPAFAAGVAGGTGQGKGKGPIPAAGFAEEKGKGKGKYDAPVYLDEGRIYGYKLWIGNLHALDQTSALQLVYQWLADGNCQADDVNVMPGGRLYEDQFYGVLSWRSADTCRRALSLLQGKSSRELATGEFKRLNVHYKIHKTVRHGK